MDRSDSEVREAIVRTVLDHFEGWFDGDADRMERALHRDLVKRQAGEDLGVTTKQRMVELTEQGEGEADAADRRVEVQVQDIDEDIASVTATDHEYVQFVRTTDGWRIANALWRFS